MLFNPSSGTIRRTSAGLLKPSAQASYTAPSGLDKVQVESIYRPAGALYILLHKGLNIVSIAVYKAPAFFLNMISPAVYIAHNMQESESNE